MFAWARLGTLEELATALTMRRLRLHQEVNIHSATLMTLVEVFTSVRDRCEHLAASCWVLERGVEERALIHLAIGHLRAHAAHKSCLES